VGWLELAVFVALATGSTARWHQRHDRTAAWLAAMFTLLGGILFADWFLPTAAKTTWAWFDRAVIVDLAAFAFCLDRFTDAFAGPPRRSHGVAWGAGLMSGVAFLLPDIVGGLPSSWPWWYALYAGLFLTGWTAVSSRAVARLWRAGRGQPNIARQRMRLLAVATVVLNGAIFLVAASEDHRWTGLASGLLFLVGFAPPAALRGHWRRPELEAFRRAEADLMRADTGAAVINLMLPHAARLVGARAAMVLDHTGIHWLYGTSRLEAAQIAAGLPRGSDNTADAPVFGTGVVGVPFGNGWLVVVPAAAAPFLSRDEIGLLSTLAHLARLALDRAEMSDRVRASLERLADREAQLAEAQRTARLGSYTWDLVNGTVNWSDEMHRLLGFTPGTVVDHGAAFAARIHPDDRDSVLAAWAAARSQVSAVSIDYRVVLPDGEVRWLQGRARPILGPDGTPAQLSGTIQDITERKLAEEAVAFQASHDALTGLPNRTVFLDRVGQALAATGHEGPAPAVLFLDVDRFKWLNDSLGHAAGDELLKVVAGRLRHAVRDQDVVARFGGDEFVVLCSVVHEAEAEAVAARLASSLAAPIAIAAHEMTVTASIGIAYAPRPAEDVTPEGLVQAADAAMYRAKEEGRNRYSVFDATTRDETRVPLETTSALAPASS